MITRAYSSCRFGQIHYFVAGTNDGGKPPLICLHMSPYSGSYWQKFQAEMARDRLVICPDNPGYGGSDAPKDKPSIADYAAAIGDLLDNLGFENVDVLGFHTGSFIGAELGIQRPDLVARLILPGLPYMPAEKRASLKENFAKPRPYFSEENYMEGRWQMTLKGRGSRSEDRTLSEFAETLRPGTRSNWGFEAVFSYDPDERLTFVQQPVLLPLPDESLTDATKAAAALFENAKTVDWPELGAALFEDQADLTAARLKNEIDN